MKDGSCLCGAVKFSFDAEAVDVDACHCVQCRKWTGHFFPSMEVPRTSLQLQGEENLSWYHSSEKIRRGFCRVCGSSLFFDPTDRKKHDWIGIALGAIEGDTFLPSIATYLWPKKAITIS